MKTKHTPGPWATAGEGNGITSVVTEDTIIPVAYVAWTNRVTQAANARLIASAPDLLAALENLENDDGSIPSHAWELVQAAIAKATGSTS